MDTVFLRARDQGVAMSGIVRTVLDRVKSHRHVGRKAIRDVLPRQVANPEGDSLGNVLAKCYIRTNRPAIVPAPPKCWLVLPVQGYVGLPKFLQHAIHIEEPAWPSTAQCHRVLERAAYHVDSKAGCGGNPSSA